MHVADQLHQTISLTNSIACVGLDPRPALLPPSIVEKVLAAHGDTAMAVAAAFYQFNCGLLDAVAGQCAAVKPQSACYEAYGSAGVKALEDSVHYAKKLGIPVIMDAKRGDIGSTAEHYQQAFLGQAPSLKNTALAGLGCPWLTINGYLGSDAVLPFLHKTPGTGGVFVLVKTSNPSSGELQDIALAANVRAKNATSDANQAMELMAQLVAQWGAGRHGQCGLTDVGAVVGATYPAQAKRLRTLMPDTIFLVPGYGAQGGTAEDALAGKRSDGRGVIVNSSRGIIAAWQKSSDKDWAAAARGALDAMNGDLNRCR
jgi:orotidine-5'-phosphate decarboxylase